MTNLRYEHRHLDVACELLAGEIETRAAEWQQLREGAGLGTELIPAGARLWLQPAAWDEADDLARRESTCCGFLDFDLAADGERIRLDVTSPSGNAQPIIACLVGLAVDRPLGCC